MSTALPDRNYRPVAWGAVCRSTKRSLSALPTIAGVMAAPVAIRLGAPSCTSAVEKSLGGRLGLQQGAVGSRPAGGFTEGGAEIDVGAILPLLATELPEKPLLFSWVIGKAPLALQRCALVLILRFGTGFYLRRRSNLRPRCPTLRSPAARRIDLVNIALKKTGHMLFQSIIPVTFVGTAIMAVI
jgi:hypothetical protein